MHENLLMAIKSLKESVEAKEETNSFSKRDKHYLIEGMRLIEDLVKEEVDIAKEEYPYEALEEAFKLFASEIYEDELKYLFITHEGMKG